MFSPTNNFRTTLNLLDSIIQIFRSPYTLKKTELYGKLLNRTELTLSKLQKY